MKKMIAMTAALTLSVGAQMAFAEGDADAGKKTFGKCKSCHQVITPDGDILVKGGRTGPNLYGVIGRTAGAADFRYSKTLTALGETGFAWTEETLAAFVKDPRGYLKEQGTDGKTKMTFKLNKGGEDVAAYLASLGQ